LKKILNENRLGYKKTRFGWIPEEWNITPLKQLCSMIKDGTHFSPSSKSGPYLYITSKNILFGRMDLNNCVYISKKDHTEIYKRCPVQYGDVLLTKDGANTGNATLNILKEPFSLLSSVAVLREKSDISSNEFILHSLLSPFGQYRIKDRMAGQAITRITLNIINNFEIILPPLPEQVEIAKILSTWDRAIEQTQNLIEAKQNLKNGLLQQLLTGRMRFPEFGKPVNNKGELPKGWIVLRLGECFEERIESNPNLPLLSITSDRGVIPRSEVDRKDTSNTDKSKYKRIAPNDIGYNTMRMWQGRSAVSNLEGIVSPAYTICTPRTLFSSIYFGYLFKYPPMINLFRRFSQGLVADTLNLKFPLFAKIKVALPEYDEQLKIAGVLKSIDNEIDLLQQKEILLQQQKKGLMQKLLSGEIRVKLN